MIITATLEQRLIDSAHLDSSTQLAASARNPFETFMKLANRDCTKSRTLDEPKNVLWLLLRLNSKQTLALRCRTCDMYSSAVKAGCASACREYARTFLKGLDIVRFSFRWPTSDLVGVSVNRMAGYLRTPVTLHHQIRRAKSSVVSHTTHIAHTHRARATRELAYITLALARFFDRNACGKSCPSDWRQAPHVPG